MSLTKISILSLVAVLALVGISMMSEMAKADSFGIAHVGTWTRSLFGGHVTHSVWHIRVGQLTVWPATVAIGNPNSLQGHLTSISLQPDPVEFNHTDEHGQSAAFIVMVSPGDPGMGIDSVETTPSHPDFNVVVDEFGGLPRMTLTPLNPGLLPLVPDMMNSFDFLPPFLYDTMFMQPMTVTLQASNGQMATFLTPAVPEPGTLWLMGAGLLALVTVRTANRRKKT